MRVMGFSHHPGALPFYTVRDAKWALRLTVGEFVHCHGEHGCACGDFPAVVVSIEDWAECPPHLLGVYAGRRLCRVGLAPTGLPAERFRFDGVNICLLPAA